MARMRKFGIPTPSLYLIDELNRKIYMEYLGDHSMTVKEFLYQLGSFTHPSNINAINCFVCVVLD